MPTPSTRRPTARAPRRVTRTPISFNPDLGFAYFFLGNSYDQLYKPAKKDDPDNVAYLEQGGRALPDRRRQAEGPTDPKEQMVRRYAFEYLIAVYGHDKLNDFAQGRAGRQGADRGRSRPTRRPTASWPSSTRTRAGSTRPKQQLLKAIDVKPNDPIGYQILAGFYNKQGDFAKTMEAWNKRAEAEPKNPEAWHTIGVYYQDKVVRRQEAAARPRRSTTR